jgi:hypothetical protein
MSSCALGLSAPNNLAQIRFHLKQLLSWMLFGFDIRPFDSRSSRLEGRVLLNEPLVAELSLSRNVIDRFVTRTRELVSQRTLRFRGNRPFPILVGRP